MSSSSEAEQLYLSRLITSNAKTFSSLPDQFKPIAQKILDLAKEYPGDACEGHYRAKIGLDSAYEWSRKYPDSALDMVTELYIRMCEQTQAKETTRGTKDVE